MLKQGSTVSGDHRTFAELGIEPKPLGLFLDKWMTRFRRFGRFGLTTQRNKEREARGLAPVPTGVGAQQPTPPNT